MVCSSCFVGTVYESVRWVELFFFQIGILNRMFLFFDLKHD